MKLFITNTRGDSLTKSIRANSKKIEGWDIIKHLADINRMNTYKFCKRFNPSVFCNHIEIPTGLIERLKIV